MRWPIKVCLFFILLGLIAFLFSLKMGLSEVQWSHVWNFLSGALADQNEGAILKHLRLPRAISAYSVGFLLAVSGCALQGILKNPLADAYTLGLSGGSAVGAIWVLYLNLTPVYFFIPLASFLGSLLAVGLVLGLSQKYLRTESRSLVLLGIMASLFLGALSVFLISLLPTDKSSAAMGWLVGEFGSVRDSWMPALLLISIPFLIVLQFKAKALTALSLGDYRARSLGFSPRKEKIQTVLVAAVLTSLAISVAGLVGFIGLVAPHIARKLSKTASFTHLLPLSGLIGGVILLCADLVGRSLSSTQEIPAGSLSALIGAPLLIFILLRSSHAQGD